MVWDHEGESFIVAFNKNSGKELWRQPRDEPSTWFTPLIVEHGGQVQIITPGTNNIRSYDLLTGELIWKGPGMTLNAIPTPIYADGVVYLTSGFRGNALYAVRLDKARGDITGTDAIVWEHHRDTPYVPSPLLYDGTLYFTKHLRGILTAFDVATGKPRFGPVRLPGVSMIYASPVGAAGRVYITSREGKVLVLKHGAELNVLATNELDDDFDASPAIVGDEIYLRGHKFLYRISQD